MAEKTEKKSGGGQIIKLALVLFAVSAIMALALGLVNELTKDTIAMRAAETTKKRICQRPRGRRIHRAGRF